MAMDEQSMYMVGSCVVLFALIFVILIYCLCSSSRQRRKKPFGILEFYQDENGAITASASGNVVSSSGSNVASTPIVTTPGSGVLVTTPLTPAGSNLVVTPTARSGVVAMSPPLSAAPAGSTGVISITTPVTASLPVMMPTIPIQVPVFQKPIITVDGKMLLQYIRSPSGCVVLFYAHWCHECHHFMPVYKRLSQDPDLAAMDIKLVKINCAQHIAVCEKHAIVQYPTVKLFKSGRYLKTYHNVRDFDTMKRFIMQVLQ